MIKNVLLNIFLINFVIMLKSSTNQTLSNDLNNKKSEADFICQPGPFDYIPESKKFEKIRERYQEKYKNYDKKFVRSNL